MIRALIPAFCCAATMSMADDLTSVTYVCERGVEVPVVYINPTSGEAYAVVRIDGKLLAMRNVISGSGARYRSGDGADAYQLWSRGDTALISYGADGQDTPLFDDCAVRQ